MVTNWPFTSKPYSLWIFRKAGRLGVLDNPVAHSSSLWEKHTRWRRTTVRTGRKTMSNTVITRHRIRTGTVPEPEKPAEVPPLTTGYVRYESSWRETPGEPTFLSMTKGLRLPHARPGFAERWRDQPGIHVGSRMQLNAWILLVSLPDGSSGCRSGIVIGTLTLPYNCNPGLKRRYGRWSLISASRTGLILRIRSGEAVSKGRSPVPAAGIPSIGPRR